MEKKRIIEKVIKIAIILFILLLLVFGIKFLFFQPYKTVYISFQELGPVDKGLGAYYRGLKVGKVRKVGFTKDFKKTLITVDVYEKDFNLPLNTQVLVKIEPETSRKYLAFIYPEKPSEKILVEGSVLEGLPFKNEGFENVLLKSINEKQIDSAMGNFLDVSAKATKISEDVSKITGIVQEILKKNQPKINQILSDTQKTTEKFPEISDNLNKTIINSNMLVKRYDCLGIGVSEMMGKRFMIPRLILGKTSFKECSELVEQEKNLE